VIVYTYIKLARFLAQLGRFVNFCTVSVVRRTKRSSWSKLSGSEGSWFFRIKEYDA